MNSQRARFFPDTNIIVAIILREQRYWSSNVLFSDLVENEHLICTILPTIETEFRHKIDQTIDLADELLGFFIAQLSLRKADPIDVWKPVKLGRGDVRKVERSFASVYEQVKNVVDVNERQKKTVVYDLVEAWIMDYWSQALKEGQEIVLDDFVDSLRATISEGRRILEDGFLGLKRRLNHVDCDWVLDSSIFSTIRGIVPDPDDVPHVSMAASFTARGGHPAIYVTNDGGVLGASRPLQSQFNLIVARPAFAYAFSL